MLEAFRHPREIDRELVDAYLARRALDYLVGFTLSPVLWRKLPGSRSAGRVQSVALRLICEREAEIEAFKPREYWTVEVEFTTPAGAALHRAADPSRRQAARPVRSRRPRRRRAPPPTRSCSAGGFAVARDRAASRSGATRRRRSPPRPCSRKPRASSGFGASRTMRIAQRLYEGVDIGGETVGLITYMRTDGVAHRRARRSPPRAALIEQRLRRGLRARARRASTRSPAKNAQEAHEAIRPTDLARTPGRGRAPISTTTSAGSTS